MHERDNVTSPAADSTRASPNPSGGGSAGASSVRSSLRGKDFAVQAAMLTPVQRKGRTAGAAVQREGNVATGSVGQAEQAEQAAPAAAPPSVAPPISYSVPGVVEIGRIANPVERNQAINQSYHAFDTAMTAYLGAPRVSNWCTYGQHASREAGAQIRNLKAAKGMIDGMGGHLANLQALNVTATNPMSWLYAVEEGWAAARTAWNDASVILSLLGEEGLVKQSVLLWLARANITQADLQRVIANFGAVANISIGDVGLGTIQSVYNAFVECVNLGIRLGTAIPGLISAMDLIYDNMVRGNREIYESVGRAYNAFLSAGLATPSGVVRGMGFGDDTRGFLAAAFDVYGQVREKANQLATMDPQDPRAGTTLTQRSALAHRANLLIGYQEQLVILQPIFDTMQTELAAMSGTMVLRDPNGTHALTANWQDFYTRMGLDPARTPPLSQINASNLGELLSNHDPRRHGTISEYFENGLHDGNIHQAPGAIREHR